MYKTPYQIAVVNALQLKIYYLYKIYKQNKIIVLFLKHNLLFFMIVKLQMYKFINLFIKFL